MASGRVLIVVPDDQACACFRLSELAFEFILSPMSDQSQLAARIDARVKEAVEEYCRAKGLKINRFVESALLDRLEELEDADDVRRLRTEGTRPLAHVLRDLKRDGLL